MTDWFNPKQIFQTWKTIITLDWSTWVQLCSALISTTAFMVKYIALGGEPVQG